MSEKWQLNAVEDTRKWAVERYLDLVADFNRNTNGELPWVPSVEEIIEAADKLTDFVVFGPEEDRPQEGKFTTVKRELRVA